LIEKGDFIFGPWENEIPCPPKGRVFLPQSDAEITSFSRQVFFGRRNPRRIYFTSVEHGGVGSLSADIQHFGLGVIRAGSTSRYS